MAQLTTVTLNGVQFYPVRVDANGTAFLRARADKLALAKSFSLRVSTNKSSQVSAVNAKIGIPFIADDLLNPQKKSLHTLRADVRLVVPGAATLAQRRDLLKTLKAAIEDAVMTGAVENLETLF